MRSSLSKAAKRAEDAMQAKAPALVPVEHITRAILVLRGHRVLLDTELAALYAVTTKRFNEQVRRNRERFPADFMFQLTPEELAALRSQFATSNAPAPHGRGGRRYLPYAFTEHGAIMAATILNSPRAVEVSVHVVRAFVMLREMLSSNREFARRFAQLEARLDKKAHRTRSGHRRHPLRHPSTHGQARHPSAGQSASPPISKRSRSARRHK